MSVTRLWVSGLGVTLLAVAGCSDSMSGSRSPTAATPIQMSERRVGDTDGGSPPDCLEEPCSYAPLIPRWQVVTADGDSLGFVCDTATACHLLATGRFEGVVFVTSLVGGQAYDTRFVVQGNIIDVVLSIMLRGDPKQSILSTAVLNARTEIVSDSACESGQRISATFGGTMPHLGKVSGYYSICVKPPAASTAAARTN